jgi:hypothetical protein
MNISGGNSGSLALIFRKRDNASEPFVTTKMPNPTIKLKFDKKLDQELAWDFYSNPEFGGCNFWKERALTHHPKLSEIGSVKNPKIFLNKYILGFYKLHERELKTHSQKSLKYLEQSQGNFFRLVNKIFDSHPWPQKEFFGVFSIFDFCPRFLDWGGFQIFLYDNRKMQLYTTFHEMLHFIFYDFAQKNFLEKFKGLSTDQGKFWDLAEVFNVVIQDTKDFIKLHGKVRGSGYPVHKDLIIEGKKIWRKKQDVRVWIIEMMKIMEE